MKIRNFSEAERFLLDYAPKTRGLKFPGKKGLVRTTYFLNLLGNPQSKLRIIHVAGTSGKGSTAYLVSQILHGLGKKTGLTLSPHVVDIRERIQINNRNIRKQKFVAYLHELIPFIEQMEFTSFGLPTYFEILIVLVFYAFTKEKVEYAVVETGLGGLYDATNTVESKNKIVVLTKIGFDHTRILGNTLSKIAAQKAGIIHNGSTVVSVWQKPTARKVIEEESKKKKASLFWLGKEANYRNVDVDTSGTRFDFSFQDVVLKNIHLKLIGTHQAENCSLALAIVYFISKRDKFVFDEASIKTALLKTHFPARFELIKIGTKTIIVDAAHNPQKMTALVTNLKGIFPGKKFDFLVAFKREKNYAKMLKHIVSVANNIIVSSFFVDRQDLVHLSQDPEKIGETLKELGVTQYEIIKDPREALQKSLLGRQEYLVITGSIYFIGELYSLLKKN